MRQSEWPREFSHITQEPKFFQINFHCKVKIKKKGTNFLKIKKNPILRTFWVDFTHFGKDQNFSKKYVLKSFFEFWASFIMEIVRKN